jgi:hypothetical protein
MRVVVPEVGSLIVGKKPQSFPRLRGVLGAPHGVFDSCVGTPDSARSRHCQATRSVPPVLEPESASHQRRRAVRSPTTAHCGTHTGPLTAARDGCGAPEIRCRWTDRAPFACSFPRLAPPNLLLRCQCYQRECLTSKTLRPCPFRRAYRPRRTHRNPSQPNLPHCRECH